MKNCSNSEQHSSLGANIPFLILSSFGICFRTGHSGRGAVGCLNLTVANLSDRRCRGWLGRRSIVLNVVVRVVRRTMVVVTGLRRIGCEGGAIGRGSICRARCNNRISRVLYLPVGDLCDRSYTRFARSIDRSRAARRSLNLPIINLCDRGGCRLARGAVVLMVVVRVMIGVTSWCLDLTIIDLSDGLCGRFARSTIVLMMMVLVFMMLRVRHRTTGRSLNLPIVDLGYRL